MIRKTFFVWTVLFFAIQNMVPGLYDFYDSFAYLPMINPNNKNIVWVQGRMQYKDIYAYNDNGKKIEPLQIFSSFQNALAALEGFPADSIQAQKLSQIDVFSDDFRGRLLLQGLLKMDWGFSLGVSIPFLNHWSYRSYIGVYRFNLDSVTVIDQTKDQSIDDFMTKQLLTNEIEKNAFTLGNGLLLRNWDRTGLGDWINYCVWEKEFAQERLFLQAAKLSLRAGLSIPVGNRVDPDHLLAFSHGNDGSVGIPFGAMLECIINDYVSCGLDFELMHLFGTTHMRRIKSSDNQTEPLLFAKAFVYKEPGMHQRLDLYTKISDSKKRFFLTLGYHYHKKGDDTIIIQSAPFLNDVANRALSLQESTAHYAIAAIAFDSSAWFKKVSVQSNLFIKAPFNGSNTLVASSIGFGLGINF